jgi:short-subunit dehydrogenase
MDRSMPDHLDPRAGPAALVTGATSGIGRATALRLSDGGSAEFVSADLTDVHAIEELASAAADVDVLVNNAGFSWFGPTTDLTADTFDALFARVGRRVHRVMSPGP